MLNKNEVLLLHAEIMKQMVPEAIESVKVFEYLVGVGFPPCEANKIDYMSKEYCLVLDAIKYQEYING